MNQQILQIRDLQVKRGGVSVLDIPELSVEEGEFLSLIGPNGTGKSTLLLTLACLIKPFYGQLFFHNTEIAKNSSVIIYRRHVSMVFQEPLLFDTTVYENVAAGLKIRNINIAQRDPIVREYLERFGISHLSSRSARKLSGGEAQRTSLARAFATKPEIIFLDEPFSSLDPPTKEGLIVDLDTILKEMKTTVLMTTHDQSEALRLSDRIAVMNSGKIIQIGTSADVMNRPVNEFVASFTGMESILKGTVAGNHEGIITADVAGRSIEAVGDLRIGTKVTCCIRPEHITLSRVRADSASSARNSLSGKIEDILSMGYFYKIILNCGFYLTSYITRSSLEEMHLKKGDDVIASFKATAVHIIRSSYSSY